MMAHLDHIEVQLVETGPMNILSMRQMLSSDDYAVGYGTYFSGLYAKIATEKLTLLGAPMTIYHSPEYNPAGNDTEFAIPIAEAVKGNETFARRPLCEICAARFIRRLDVGLCQTEGMDRK